MKGLAVVTFCLAGILCAPEAGAKTIDVWPTGGAADVENVRAAIGAAHEGDTILLRAGTFMWTNDTPVAPLLVALGVPITVSNLTIVGERLGNERLSRLVGPIGADGYPRLYAGRAANAAFFVGPGVTGTTIRDLHFESFEVAVALLQTRLPEAAWAFVAGADFSRGADDTTIEGNVARNCNSFVKGIGGNDRLRVSHNDIEIVARNTALADAVASRVSLADQAALVDFVGNPSTGDGYFAGAVAIANVLLSNNATASDPPDKVVVEGNRITGPDARLQLVRFTRPSDGRMLTTTLRTLGILLRGGTKARIESNDIRSLSVALNLSGEGNPLVSYNVTSGCQLGLAIQDFSENDPTFGLAVPATATQDVLVRMNQFTASVRPASPYGLLLGGNGILTFADDSLFVGNYFAGNEFNDVLLFLGGPTDMNLAEANLILVRVGTKIAVFPPTAITSPAFETNKIVDSQTHADYAALVHDPGPPDTIDNAELSP